MELRKLIDILGLISILWMVIRAWVYPDDPAWFAAIAAAVSFWLAVRVVVTCSCGEQWWPAPGLIFLLLAMLTNHIGAFVHFGEGWGPSVEPEAAWNMIWSFTLAYVCVAISTWVYYKLSGLDIHKLVAKFYANPIIVSPSQGSLLVPALILFIIGLGASLYLLGGKFDILDVIRALSSGAESQAKLIAYAAREGLSGSDGNRGSGYLDQMRIAVMPMIALMWLVTARVTKQKLYFWLTVGAVGITSITMVSALQRAPLVLFILQAAVVLMVTYKTKPNVRWLYGFAIAVFLFFGMTILLGRGRTADTFNEKMILKWDSVVRRVYLSNSLSSVKTFELFPKYEEFRYGGTWVKDLANLAPGKGKGLSAEVYEYIWKEPGNGGVHYIAEMWANGGYGVVAGVSFLTGLFMFWLNLKVLTIRRRTPLHIAYWGMIMFCAGLVGYGGVMTPISRGVIAITFLFMILSSFEKISKRLQGRLSKITNPDPGSVS